MNIRLDKYIANSGIVSRRKVKELIKNGEVLINGEGAKEQGQRIDPEKDKVEVLGKKLKKNANYNYVILNKPLGVLSAAFDPEGRTTVTSLVKSNIRLYPVGRLDADSIGLILLTNDGELTHKLTHPKFHIPKTYEVLVKGKVSEYKLNLLRNGVVLKDGITSKAQVKILEEFKFTTKMELIIYEGRNRQIRRMCGKLELEVLELKRVKIGSIELANLAPGKNRTLSQKEINSLKEAVGLR